MQLKSNTRLRWILKASGIIAAMAASFALGLLVSKPAQTLAALGQNGSKTVTLASIVGVNTSPPSGVSSTVDFKEFWDLWQRLKDSYYKQPVDEKKMFYGAMSGLASSLDDPYTVYFEPTTAQEFSDQLQGKFEGIGAEIGIKDDQLQVIAPLPDTPADKAGLKTGDYILKINSQDTSNMSVDKAVSLIRGDKGTVVTLNIGRYKTTTDAKGKEKKTPYTLDIPITRDVIVVKSVKLTYLKGNIANVEITNFNQDTSDLFSKAVDDMVSKDVKGIVLDLRSDPGGYLDRAISVAGEWVGDQIVVKERRQGKIVDEYHGTGSGRLKGIPTVVLVNQGSASASEIVSGCLQDYGVAKIVGMQTFGKGSVQDYTEFSDKSAVKITIAEWLTPKERSINKQGVTPDIKVDKTDDDIHANRDPQLDKALELLGVKPAQQAAAAATSSKAKSSK